MTMTDDEIKALLNSFFETQAHTTYVGSRYVPIFGRKGSQVIDWDNKAPYEPLTVVLHEGNSFTSRCYVPADIDITNANFWAKTGDYNAQIEAYRNEVAAFSGRIDAVEADNVNVNKAVDAVKTDVTALRTDVDEEVTNRTNADAVLGTRVDSTNEALSTEVTDRTDADAALGTRIDKIIQKKNMVVLGDSWSSETSTNSVWSNKVAKNLNLVNNNYSKDGASITSETNNYNMQLSLANEKITDKNSVTRIYIAGTVNDFQNNIPYSTWNTAITTLINNCKSYFPNAIITVLFFNTFPIHNKTHDIPIAYFKNNIDYYYTSSTKDVTVKYCPSCILPTTTNFLDDGVHPSSTGSSILANYIINGTVKQPALTESNVIKESEDSEDPIFDILNSTVSSIKYTIIKNSELSLYCNISIRLNTVNTSAIEVLKVKDTSNLLATTEKNINLFITPDVVESIDSNGIPKFTILPSNVNTVVTFDFTVLI